MNNKLALYDTSYSVRTQRIAQITALFNTSISAVVGVLSIPIIVSFVGVELYGQWAIIFAYAGLASIVEFGVPKFIVQGIPRGKGCKAKQELWWAALTLLAVKILVVLVLVALVGLFGLVRGIYYLAFSLIISGLLFSYVRGFFEAVQSVYVANIYSLVQTVVMYLLTGIAAYQGGDLEWLIFATCLGHSVVSIVFFFHAIFLSGIPNKFFIAEAYELQKASMPFAGISILNSMSIPIARFVINGLDPTGSAHAKFDIGLKLGVGALALLNSLISHLHGKLALVSASQVKELFVIARKQFYYTCAACFLGVSFFLLEGEVLLRLVGLGAVAGDSLIFVLFVSLCFSGVFEPLIRVLWVLDKVYLTAWMRVAQLCIFLFFLVSLIVFCKDPEFSVIVSYSLSLVLGGIGVWWMYHANAK